MAKPTSETYKLFLTQLSRWPADPLRPNTQFVPAMTRRVQKMQEEQEQRQQGAAAASLAANPGTTPTDAELRREIEALVSLLDNKFAIKYRLSNRIWRPRVNPDYFSNIIKDLEATKSRSWFGSQWIRLKGLVRLQD